MDFTKLFSWLSSRRSEIDLKDSDEQQALKSALKYSKMSGCIHHIIYHVYKGESEILTFNVTREEDRNGKLSDIVDINGSQYYITDSDDEKQIVSHLICDQLANDISTIRIEIEQSILSKHNKERLS